MDFIKNFFHYNKHQSEQKYLSDNVFEQIKNFQYWYLTEEQKLLIDKLILNEKLKERYNFYGLCKECKQPNTGSFWCQSCNAKRFQQNFKNWTSGNSDVDKLIQESQLNAKTHYEKLEWIEYNRFYDIEYITKGGFGKIYRAFWKDGLIEYWIYEINQWIRNEYNSKDVALKSLNNSKDITSEFLNEYAEKGNLRQILNREFNSLSWNTKLEILCHIAHGLNDIHKEGLNHQDFHSGNILISDSYYSITDLGLLSNGLPPYHDMAHDEFLAIKICQGLRPRLNIKAPQLLDDLFKQCVDADPSKRPTADYLFEIFVQWWNAINYNEADSEICKQFVEADEFNKQQQSSAKSSINSEFNYTTHPQAIYTSRLLNFNNLPKPKNASYKKEYSDSTKIDFTKFNINSRGKFKLFI
ncbi:kinase-like domain-containing protein [Glomus cerebriforme]|uniref:Kinase-like domain-containing protein n=1 Tax=Glomus cerebriforme TaxID=658196 RepID=A0A397S6U6_9GLOM|nr:kinase-like domain-containing protein [Glomus cerebriforme]